MLNGFNHSVDVGEYVVLIAAGGSTACDVAPTAALELNALKMSTIACSRCVPRRRSDFDSRRSSCVRRGVYIVPGSSRLRVRVEAPVRLRPSNGRASVFPKVHAARIC